MNSDSLSQLLAQSESDTLDFKLTHYDLGVPGDDGKTKERKRAKFAKDILAFGNVWRDESRYIVIGAKRLSDGTMNAPGVREHIDGADLVQVLEGLVHPCPRFHYAQVELNCRQYAVIEIFAERSIGPFLPSRMLVEGTERSNRCYAKIRSTADVTPEMLKLVPQSNRIFGRGSMAARCFLQCSSLPSKYGRGWLKMLNLQVTTAITSWYSP